MSAKCRDRLNGNPIRILFLEYEFGCFCKFFNFKLTLYYLRMRGPMILEMSNILEKIDLITTKRNSTFLITFYFNSSILYFIYFV